MGIVIGMSLGFDQWVAIGIVISMSLGFDKMISIGIVIRMSLGFDKLVAIGIVIDERLEIAFSVFNCAPNTLRENLIYFFWQQILDFTKFNTLKLA
jgi:hypothetical protein